MCPERYNLSNSIRMNVDSEYIYIYEMSKGVERSTERFIRCSPKGLVRSFGSLSWNLIWLKEDENTHTLMPKFE